MAKKCYNRTGGASMNGITPGGKQDRNKKPVKKLVSAPSFRLKGAGWYETDFKTGSKKNIVDTKDEKPKQPKKQTKTTEQSKSKSSDKKT